MPMNAIYRGSADLPEIIPVFPLPGALLLPRGQMPLNIFEPRYLAMIDDALRDGHRLIGMIQPDPRASRPRGQAQRCSRSAASAASPSSPRPATAAICCSSPASRASASRRSSRSRPPIANAASPTQPFADDFIARKGEDEVDRKAVLEALTAFLKANNLKTDWEGIESAPNEALVNALAMMSPYGAAEKQALLEAPDLKIARRDPGRRHRDRARQEDRRRRRDAVAVTIGAVDPLSLPP